MKPGGFSFPVAGRGFSFPLPPSPFSFFTKEIKFMACIIAEVA